MPPVYRARFYPQIIFRVEQVRYPSVCIQQVIAYALGDTVTINLQMGAVRFEDITAPVGGRIGVCAELPPRTLEREIEPLVRIVQHADQLAEVGSPGMGQWLTVVAVVAYRIEMTIGVRACRVIFGKEIQVFDAERIEAAETELRSPFVIHMAVAREKLLCGKFA